MFVLPSDQVRAFADLLRGALDLPQGDAGKMEYRIEHFARPRTRLRFTAGDGVIITCRSISLFGIRWFSVGVPRPSAVDLLEIFDSGP